MFRISKPGNIAKKFCYSSPNLLVVFGKYRDEDDVTHDAYCVLAKQLATAEPLYAAKLRYSYIYEILVQTSSGGGNRAVRITTSS